MEWVLVSDHFSPSRMSKTFKSHAEDIQGDFLW